MIVACGSQMKRYVPRSTATVQMYVRTAATLVLRFTPGPIRWKSWIAERS